MKFSSFTYLAIILATCPTTVLCWGTTSSPVYPTTSSPIYPTTSSPVYPTTSTCLTITETTGSTCPPIYSCVVAECIVATTVTFDCNCASVYTTTACETACHTGCATTTIVLYPPCPTSEPFPTSSSYSASPSSLTSLSSSTSTSSSTYWSNSTVTTSSSSACSASTESLPPPPPTYPTSPITTVTVTSSPLSLPSGTGTQPVTTLQSAATSTTTGLPSPTIQIGGGSRNGFSILEGGVLAGLIGAVVGIL